MPFVSNVKDPAEKSDYVVGFSKALNTVQDNRLIDDKNLSQAQNVILEVNGIARRPGTDKVFDEGGGSYVYGSAPFYKKTDGTNKFVRVANQRLQYLDGSSWTDVDATVFQNLDTNFIQARDELFIYNGTDKLRRYDGSSLLTYTEVNTPTNLTVTSTGGTGTTSYSYRVAAFNETGETDACTAVSISNGHAEEDLSASKYIALDWDDMANADGYNIYGRTSTGYGEVYLATVYESSYNDTGTDDLNTTKLPSDENTTGGIKAKGGCFTLSRQFVYGVTEGSTYYPTRLYYSGTLDYVDSFVGGEYGGGWLEIYSNDGGEIVDVVPYQDGVLVFKTNGIYKFYFTSTGLPTITEVTREHGGVSGRGAQRTENDVLYVAQKDDRIAVMTLGYEEDYSVDQLRTNEVSIFISDQLQNVNRAQLDSIATWKFEDTFGFSYPNQGTTENSRGFVLDTRFGGWVFWNGLPMEANHYTVYDDGTDVKLYGGSNADGYMIEMFTDDRNDDGASYKSIVGTKFYNGDMFDVDKVWRNPTLWFEYVTGGSMSIEFWVDGNRQAGEVSVSTSTPGAGVGADLPGTFLAGTMTSGFTIQEDRADVPVEILTIQIARSMGFYIIDSSVNTNWLFMGLHLQYSPLIGKPASGVQRVNPS